MRTKALEATHHIPYKLVQSLSTTQPSSQTSNSTTSGVEREVQIRIENDVLKKGRNDSILVNAAVIRQSPGKLIFVLEPTKSQFLQRNFKLETRLEIHHRGNIFLVEKISYSSRPIHPILYTSFLSPDPSYQAPVTGFDWEMARHWEKPAQTPEEYAAHFFNPLIEKVRCRDGYVPMILDNGNRTIPVTAKPFDGVIYDIFGHQSEYSMNSEKPKYVLLETRSYFDRHKFPVEKGCVLRSDLEELDCIDVQYPFFPYHPVITIKSTFRTFRNLI